MTWDSYEKAAEKGLMPIFWKIFWFLVITGVVIGVAGNIFGWFGEAAQVARDEFGPQAALEKYEWFINTNEAINKMDEDITLFESRYNEIESEYKANYGENPADWQTHTQIQYNSERETARDDLMAVTSQRNNLVKEYNASSEKFNWLPFRDNPDLPPEMLEEYVSGV